MDPLLNCCAPCARLGEEPPRKRRRAKQFAHSPEMVQGRIRQLRQELISTGRDVNRHRRDVGQLPSPLGPDWQEFSALLTAWIAEDPSTFWGGGTMDEIEAWEQQLDRIRTRLADAGVTLDAGAVATRSHQTGPLTPALREAAEGAAEVARQGVSTVAILGVGLALAAGAYFYSQQSRRAV